MLLEEKVKAFCSSNDFFKDTELTCELIEQSWQRMHLNGIDIDTYSAASCLKPYNQIEQPLRWPITEPGKRQTTYLEFPTEHLFQTILHEQELKPEAISETSVNSILQKLRDAFKVIENVTWIACDIVRLVRSIVVLHTEDDEIDVSYSHPKIPFSIFVSVCEKETEVSDLRVAESIVHEAMHLKLTLIERLVPLVDVSSANLYFSPWRNELRPARGVLHGLFVFKVIHDFFKELQLNATHGVEDDYLEFRIEQIKNEISMLDDFANCPDLTQDGAILSTNLLPLN